MTCSRKNRSYKAPSARLLLMLWVGLFLCLPSLEVLAQEWKSNIIPGRVMVKFKFDEIELPEGEAKADLKRVTIRSGDLKRVLQRFKVEDFAKVVPAAVKGDTLRVLPDGRSVRLTDFSQLHLLRFPTEISVDSVVADLQKLDQVIYAEPDQFLSPDVEPNDEFFDDQWHLQQTGGANDDEDIDAPEAWNLSKGDGVKIAIIDHGVRRSHDDFVGKIVGGETTVSVIPGFNNHGTKVAGAAGAATDNGDGVAGVGWNAKIIPYDNQNELSGSVSDINAAVAAGADIINMSWSNTTTPLFSQSLKDALDNAFAQSVALVTSAGNDQQPIPYLALPQVFDGMVTTVSATSRNGGFRSNSNFGYFIDVAAPGFQIKTTDGDTDSDYASPGGTTMSTPIVSGIMALLKALEPSLIDRDFERIIELSADKTNEDDFPYDANGWNDHMGHGRVNARQALDLLAANEIFHWTASGGSVNSIVNSTWLFYDLPGGHSGGTYVGKRYDVIQTVFFPQSFATPPEVWGRVVGSVGYNASHGGLNYSIGWCEPIIVDEFGANLRTYVYELWTVGGSYLGFFPTTPANVQFAYSALGTPGTPPLPPPPPQNLAITNPDPFGDTYHYYVKAENENGESSASNEVETAGDQGFGKKSPRPEQFTLHQNFPNPFNPTTEIRYELPENSQVTLTIYNLVGQKIRTLVDQEKGQGYYTAVWDGKDGFGKQVASGVYVYRMQAISNNTNSPPFEAKRKMTLLR